MSLAANLDFFSLRSFVSACLSTRRPSLPPPPTPLVFVLVSHLETCKPVVMCTFHSDSDSFKQRLKNHPLLHGLCTNAHRALSRLCMCNLNARGGGYHVERAINLRKINKHWYSVTPERQVPFVGPFYTRAMVL